MLAYSTIGVNHMAQSVVFYDAVFAPLGVTRDTTSRTWTGYSRAGESARFYLTMPHEGAAATAGNGAMLAFLAPDRAAVDSFYAAVLEQGGVAEGEPGSGEGPEPAAYAVYVRDLDGNRLCAFVRV